MGSLILFVALAGGGRVEYDHGYFPGRMTGMKDPLPWVAIVEKSTVVGTYKTHDRKPALIIECRIGMEIMTLDSFRKHAGTVWIRKKPKWLPVLDDSDLDVPIEYEPRKP